jgi:hypothetical protein
MSEFELCFKDFLEGRFGPVPGAFGKYGVKTPGMRTGSLDHSNNNYYARIEAGKSLENEIRQSLAELGIVTKDSSARNDQNMGIDGYITSFDGGRTPKNPALSFQLKARKSASGNDILWESVKPWSDKIKTRFEEMGDFAFTGKDMRCKANVLLSLGNNGSIVRIRQVPETIQIAKKMTALLIEEMRRSGRTATRTQWGEARLVKDPSYQATATTSLASGGVFKINCFIQPGAYEWKQDIQLKTPISAV